MGILHSFVSKPDVDAMYLTMEFGAMLHTGTVIGNEMRTATVIKSVMIVEEIVVFRGEMRLSNSLHATFVLPFSRFIAAFCLCLSDSP